MANARTSLSRWLVAWDLIHIARLLFPAQQSNQQRGQTPLLTFVHGASKKHSCSRFSYKAYSQICRKYCPAQRIKTPPQPASKRPNQPKPAKTCRNRVLPGVSTCQIGLKVPWNKREQLHYQEPTRHSIPCPYIRFAGAPVRLNNRSGHCGYGCVAYKIRYIGAGEAYGRETD